MFCASRNHFQSLLTKFASCEHASYSQWRRPGHAISRSYSDLNCLDVEWQCSAVAQKQRKCEMNSPALYASCTSIWWFFSVFLEASVFLQLRICAVFTAKHLLFIRSSPQNTSCLLLYTSYLFLSPRPTDTCTISSCSCPWIFLFAYITQVIGQAWSDRKHRNQERTAKITFWWMSTDANMSPTLMNFVGTWSSTFSSRLLWTQWALCSMSHSPTTVSQQDCLGMV